MYHRCWETHYNSVPLGIGAVVKTGEAKTSVQAEIAATLVVVMKS